MRRSRQITDAKKPILETKRTSLLLERIEASNKKVARYDQLIHDLKAT